MKFFSATILIEHVLYRQYWHAQVQTWAMLLFLVTVKNFDVCTVTMGVAPKEYIRPWFTSMVPCQMATCTEFTYLIRMRSVVGKEWLLSQG